MRIVIETIPHQQQRYNTVGDWRYLEDDTLLIRVSKMSDSRYEFLVGVHEVIEAELCRHDGVTQKEVDDFDIRFEQLRADRGDTITDEPGDHPEAPYSIQHCIATGIERLLAAVLLVDWYEYEQELNKLGDSYGRKG